jgi:hypothetical protein
MLILNQEDAMTGSHHCFSWDLAKSAVRWLREAGSHLSRHAAGAVTERCDREIAPLRRMEERHPASSEYRGDDLARLFGSATVLISEVTPWD